MYYPRRENKGADLLCSRGSVFVFSWVKIWFSHGMAEFSGLFLVFVLSKHKKISYKYLQILAKDCFS